MNFGSSRVEIPTKVAWLLGAVLVGALLAVMFLAGMVVSDGKAAVEPDPEPVTPSAYAQSDPTATPTRERPTAEPFSVPTSTPTRAPTATIPPSPSPTTPPTPSIMRSKRAYGDCLSLTLHEIGLLAMGEFTPWPEYGSQSVAGTIFYRTIEYISDHCRPLAPEPATPGTASTSLRCLPDALRTFYRLHVPEGADSEQYRALAAEFALTVCQPSARR